MNPIRRRRLGGNLYPNIAAQLTAASSRFWSLASNSSVQMGANIDCTIAGWVYPTSFPAGFPVLFIKNQGAPNIEYAAIVDAAQTRFFVQVSPGGTATGLATVTTPTGSLTAGAWSFVVFRYDGTNISASVNNAALTNTAFSGDIFAGTSRFALGSNDSGNNYLNGLLDSFGVWRSTRGGGGALTTAQITKLYKADIGMAYRDLDADLKTALVAWWNFDGNGNDSQGANNLTNNAGITFVAGKR